ncbi:TonB-dependent receptor domain-containing protein [Silvibacterium sp.]|uniref:TonB-dependent receptor domain-containing protein n=1 Tax=Silvibacterium sp. TaxID=1964179 RepID=UPI0039E6DB5B
MLVFAVNKRPHGGKSARRIALPIALLASAAALHAQEFTGHVSDASKAVIPKALITVHNELTNETLQTITTGAGDYTIPYLKPGTYSVTAESPGFDKQEKLHIYLETGKTATIDFVMKVGTKVETVTVADNALLDASKADRGEVVENERVTELPLNGRDPNMLSILNAGAVWTGSIQYQRPFDDTQENLSINGGGAGQNELMLDGMTNEAASANNTANSKIAYVPPVDSVQEFKIVTNPYDAQYGRGSGGVVDMTLKSGTNKIHGDAYEFARRSFLDSNTWQNNWLLASTGDEAEYGRPQHKLDQYGAELDGPVYLPKIYDGRNRSFFLLQYENWNEIVPNALVTSVPSPQWVNGDFSNLTWWDGSEYAPITIYDPLTLHQNAGGAYVRNAFPGNVIPTGRINPVAQKIMSYYPAPNTTPATGTNPFANNYSTPNPTTDRYRNVIGKWDQNFSPADRFTLRYGYWERVEIRSTNGMPGAIAQGELPHGERSHTFATEWIHTFTPKLFFDFRANVIVRADYTFDGPSGFDPTALGWSASEVNQLGSAARQEFPLIEPSEFAYIGNNGSSQTVSNSLNLFPSVTWNHGKHTIHAGLDLRLQQSVNDIVNGGPYFWVDRQWTQSNYIDADWTNDSGNSFASMLLGTPTSGSNTINATSFWSQHYWAPFLQDDWKLTRKLTLNLGVRYDLNPSAVERHNGADYAFDTSVTNPVNAQVNSSLLPGPVLGGVTFLGVNGNPRSLYALTKTNIQPRVGFAYAHDPDTVLRGGFGEMIRNPQTGGNTLGWSATTQFNATLDGGMTPYDTLSNPFPTVLQPTGSSTGLLTDLGQGPWDINPKYRTPSFWTYSLGVEHKFLKRDTVELSYVGSRLYNADSSDNINHESSAYYSKCNLDQGGNPALCNNDYPTNPFYNIPAFNGSSYYSATTIQGANLTRPFTAFGDIIRYQLNDGRSWYNSLQLTAMHKWTNALTLHGTWTWSKLMDAGGWTDETYRVPYRGLDGNDRTHRITISAVYDLPVGRGRTVGGDMNRLLDGVIGGWELGSLYVYETGWPWAVPDNPGENYIHNAWVPRHVDKTTGYIRGVAACVRQWQQDSNGDWSQQMLAFNYTGGCPQADFSVVPDWGEYHNTVATGIRVPNNQQFDVNLSKNFQVVSRMKLQLRLEAFNALNHPLWQEAYEGSAQDVNFGTIEKGPWAQSNLPRQVQVAVKLMW